MKKMGLLRDFGSEHRVKISCENSKTLLTLKGEKRKMHVTNGEILIRHVWDCIIQYFSLVKARHLAKVEKSMRFGRSIRSEISPNDSISASSIVCGTTADTLKNSFARNE